MSSSQNANNYLAYIVNRELAFEARIMTDGKNFRITFFDELIGTESPFDIVHSSFEAAVLGALNAPCLKANAVLVLPETMGLESLR